METLLDLNENNEEDIVSSLELLYSNNNQLSIIEKKFNKLTNIEISPMIEVILIQYYLVILGGDYNNIGLVEETENYIKKIENNLIKINKVTNKDLDLKIVKITETMIKNKEKANKLFSEIYIIYNEYLNKSKIEEYSKKYYLFDLHLLQKNTLSLSKDNKNLNLHLNSLNKYFEILNNILETFNDENDIYYKFIDSQISVLELQIEMIKS